MVINIRGTHGSGKSTIVRKILERYPVREEIRTHIRKRPWGYLCFQSSPVEASTNMKQPVFIPGHYETPCGGCDTISIVEDTYNRIREHASQGHHVLFEGILAQHYALKKFLTLKQFPLKVIILTTSLEECIAAVQARRAESGKEPLADVSSIRVEHRGVEVKVPKLRESGVDVAFMSRDEALVFTLQQLGLE